MGLDGVLQPLAVEDDRVLLRDGDGPSRAEQVGGPPIELDVQLVREYGAPSQDGQIPDLRLSPNPVTRAP